MYAHSGLLVLRKGESDSLRLWPQFFACHEFSDFVYGMSRDNTCKIIETKPYSAESTLEHTIKLQEQGAINYKVESAFMMASYAYAIWGENPKIVNVPSRSGLVGCWGHDTLNAQFVEHLLKLNQQRFPQADNTLNSYSHKLIDRIVGHLPHDPRAMAVLYAGPRTSLVLTTRNSSLSVWVVYIDGGYLVVWSTQEDFMEQVSSMMDTQTDRQWLYVPVKFGPNNLLSLHPQHLVTKLHKNLASNKGNSNKYVYGIQYLRNYLQRQVCSIFPNEKGRFDYPDPTNE